MTAESAPGPASADPPGLFIRLRGHLSLSRVQATLGIIAALLSIGGFLYGYLRPGKTVAADQGEIVAIVQEAKSGQPVADATVELLTLHDALVTMVPPAAGAGTAKAPMKEGTYRLRVMHPKYSTESRQIYVLAGQTAQIHVRLSPRPAPPPPPPPAVVEKPASSPYDNIKKLFH